LPLAAQAVVLIECVIKVSLQNIARQNACSALLDADDEFCSAAALISTDTASFGLIL
jgi:hypothetical protein